MKQCLKNFFDCIDADDISDELTEEGTWDKLVGKEYPEAIKKVMRLVCKEQPNLVKEMFDFVKGFASRPHEGIRVAATCLVNVLLDNIVNNRELVHAAVNILLQRSGTDEKASVKFHALEGLANLTRQPKDIVRLEI